MTKFYIAGYCLIICAMAAADYATYTKGKKASNSIRNIREIPLMMKYYFSTMQFIGTAFIMISNTWAVIWYYAFIIQFNPFGMTLVRKNVISHRTNMFLYAFELILGFPVSYRHGYKDLRYVTPQILGIAAAMWRMRPWPKFVPRNKYLIWTVTFALFHWSGLRRAMEENNPKEVWWWCRLADVEVYICIAYYFTNNLMRRRKPRAATTEMVGTSRRLKRKFRGIHLHAHRV